MKKISFKRVAATAVAALMMTGSVSFASTMNVLNFSIAASAEDNAGETTNVRKTIKVIGMDKDDTSTVTAYQIIKGTYRDGLFTGYTLREELGNLTISDMQKPNETEITTIASAIRSEKVAINGVKMTRAAQAEQDGTVEFTTDVEPGLYLVLVTDSKEGYLYNPAVVAVNLTDATDVAGTARGGEVDMRTYFQYPPEAYLKSNKVNVDKVIVNDDGTTADGTSAAYGDKVHFRIDKMVIPSFSEQYKKVTYKITDELESGAFDGIQDITVKVDNVVTKAGSDTFTVIGKDKNGIEVNPIEKDGVYSFPACVSFAIDFSQTYLLSNPGKAVVVDYYSVISENAGYNFSENHNTAKIEYTNNPDGETTTVRDTSYHYTFGISALIDAEDTTEVTPGQTKIKHITNEINKVSKDSNEYEEIVDNDGKTVVMKNKYALAGAEFTLYNSFERSNSTKVASCVSNENGQVSFKGLNAGTYYLAETKAPDGYSIKKTVYLVEIDATFDDIGVLTAYSINTYIADSKGQKGEAVQSAKYTNSNYTINPDGSVTNEITIVEDVNKPVAIINTTLALLPSTGGAGTVMITVVASLGMAVFLAVFIVNKKKKKENID